VRQASPAERRNEAVEWLRDLLSAGPVPVTTMYAEARAAGLAWRTIQRAASALRVMSSRIGYGSDGGWQWSLPVAPGDAAPAEIDL
jgi:putative DNA primase/helicase